MSNWHINSYGDAGATTVCSSESNVYMLTYYQGNIQEKNLLDATSFNVRTRNASDAKSGGNNMVHIGDCGLTELILVSWLHGGEHSSSTCDLAGTISPCFKCWTRGVSAGVAALLSVYGISTSVTFNSRLQYILSLSWQKLAASPQPCWVFSASFICFLSKNVIFIIRLIYLIVLTNSKKSNWCFPTIWSCFPVPRCSLGHRDSLSNHHYQCTHSGKCDNEHLINICQFLWQYHKSFLSMLVYEPIQFVIAMMGVLTLYIYWSV